MNLLFVTFWRKREKAFCFLAHLHNFLSPQNLQRKPGCLKAWMFPVMRVRADIASSSRSLTQPSSPLKDLYKCCCSFTLMRRHTCPSSCALPPLLSAPAGNVGGLTVKELKIETYHVISRLALVPGSSFWFHLVVKQQLPMKRWHFATCRRQMYWSVSSQKHTSILVPLRQRRLCWRPLQAIMLEGTVRDTHRTVDRYFSGSIYWMTSGDTAEYRMEI